MLSNQEEHGPSITRVSIFSDTYNDYMQEREEEHREINIEEGYSDDELDVLAGQNPYLRNIIEDGNVTIVSKEEHERYLRGKNEH